MEITVGILMIGGLVFFTGGAIGILRFPDFYTRLHPAGKLDTAGQLLALSAVALYVVKDLSLSNVLTAAKIGLIVVFVYITSPTATHAIVDAGVRAGLNAWEKEADDDLAD
jgi:multicomponent Na+:H+ antiporter subunit G